MRPVISIIALALLSSACSQQPVRNQTTDDRVVSVWSELNASGKLEVRAVIRSGDCPELTVDGKQLPMVLREPVTAAFPLPVCVVEIPTAVKEIRLLEHQVPAMPSSIQRILVLGDTGCRLKANSEGGTRVQACNDTRDWPLITVAHAAADWKPDVVIHVGDYHYREAKCPENNPSCKNATAGDVWASWNEDFLTPAASLLSAAPWIFVRGNHEDCDRGGVGWTALIDPLPFEKCRAQTHPYDVSLGDHTISVIDAADDGNVQPSFAKVKTTPDHYHWVVLHRPVLTPGSDDEATHVIRFPKALMSKNTRVGLVMAGHVHTSSLNRFTDQRPPEVISGNGGTALEKDASYKGIKGVIADGFKDFGFFTLERVGDGVWTAIVHDRDGHTVHECKLTESPKKKTRFDCHQSVGM